MHAEKAPVAKLGIVGDLPAPAFFIDDLALDGCQIERSEGGHCVLDAHRSFSAPRSVSIVCHALPFGDASASPLGSLAHNASTATASGQMVPARSRATKVLLNG